MRPEHWLFTIPLRLRSLFRRAQADQELDDELRDHLQRKTEEYLAQRLTQKDAHRRARLDLGGLEQTKEKCRDARRINWIQDVMQDLCYGLRMLRKSPGFTTTAILTLALGIGANTAIFTLLRASLWTPLPVKDPKELFHLVRASSQGDFAGEFSYSYPLFQQFSKTAALWGEVLAAETVGSTKFGLNGVSDERVAGEAISGNFFSVLNVGPIVGRVLEPQDDNVLGGNHIAVLSYAFWKRRFQSDASILGKRILYDETPYTVVGIARPGFGGIEQEVSVDVWVPISAVAVDRGWPLTDPNISSLRLLVRLHDGVDPGRAQAVFEAAFRTQVADALLPSASTRFKQMLEAQHITVRPAASGLATTGRKYEKSLLVLFAVVAIVLLISCANIANLILARNSARHNEIVVRLALGASRARVAWQLFPENLTLSLSGAFVGLLFSVWGTHALVSLLPLSPLPMVFNIQPDFVVFGFAAAVAVATAILFGLGPALRTSREKLELSLHGGQRVIGSSWSGRLLITGQLALSLPLLVCAGLFVDTLHNLKSSDLGFHAEHVMTFDLSYPKATSQDRLRQACAEIKQRLESHQGVIVASYGSGVYGHGGLSGGVDVIGNPSPGKDNEVGLISAGPGFFEAIGLGLLQGRYLDSQDQAEKPPVAVVNESFARHYFGSNSAIGQRIRLAFERQITREIVGVVRDAKHYGVRERVWRMVYLPAQKGDSFFVRANLHPQLLAGIIRADVAASDKTLQVQEVRPLVTVVNDMISQERLTAMLSSAFGVLACIIAAIGLYGVVAYSVSRRTNEFGIRIALGAQRTDIRALVLRQTLVVILCGVAIGIAGALAVVRLLSSAISGMLYGIKPTDVSLFIGATVSLVAIALLAAFLPARRASRIDPLVALRYE
ncbi:MAG TPA: ABC transporter permease [Candidatus Bathyarchaeia archaeon]|jgi:predicted permease|nr:ABC transporter permease [Candidatus Bathyarchaeia archaeon]